VQVLAAGHVAALALVADAVAVRVLLEVVRPLGAVVRGAVVLVPAQAVGVLVVVLVEGTGIGAVEDRVVVRVGAVRVGALRLLVQVVGAVAVGVVVLLARRADRTR
jgi:hypothetical protein